jgi:hypothetical protein
MKNEFPPGVSKSMVNPIEYRNAVYDLIMPPEFNLSPKIRPNILVCVELTPQFVSKGIPALCRVLCIGDTEHSSLSGFDSI